jgi:hypothetical protein
MTPTQAAFIRDCIAADRSMRTRLAAGEIAGNDERGVEVFGRDRRTATALESLGIVELVNLGFINPRAFLGRYRLHD